MEELYLKLIDITDKERVIDYINELIMYGSKTDGLWYDDSESFEVMLENLKRHENYKFENYEQQETPCFQYLLIRKSDNKMVGAVSIRPYLTKRLNDDFGGNIGDSIRPTERRKGYGTQALKLAIEKCKELNPAIKKIVLGCYKYNIGSKKCIIKNGGVLVDEKISLKTMQKYEIRL